MEGPAGVTGSTGDVKVSAKTLAPLSAEDIARIRAAREAAHARRINAIGIRRAAKDRKRAGQRRAKASRKRNR